EPHDHARVRVSEELLAVDRLADGVVVALFPGNLRGVDREELTSHGNLPIDPGLPGPRPSLRAAKMGHVAGSAWAIIRFIPSRGRVRNLGPPEFPHVSRPDSLGNGRVPTVRGRR